MTDLAKLYPIMNAIAFIPARGGSKRLPGKNTRSFAGRPLIAYSIAFARYCGINHVIVSTDSTEIADVANACGSEVLMRPAALSSDTATTAAAAQHCMQYCTGQGIEADVFVTLQPTNPLRPADLFDIAMKLYNEKPCDCVMSVTRNKHKLGQLEDGYFKAQSYEPGMRSQDLKPLFYENGLIYLSRPELVLNGELFGSRIQTVETQELYAMADIDEEFDFELAEHLYRQYPRLFTYFYQS